MKHNFNKKNRDEKTIKYFTEKCQCWPKLPVSRSYKWAYLLSYRLVRLSSAARKNVLVKVPIEPASTRKLSGNKMDQKAKQVEKMKQFKLEDFNIDYALKF